MYTVLESIRNLMEFWKENAEAYQYTHREFSRDVARKLPSYSDKKITSEQVTILAALAVAHGSHTQYTSSDLIHISVFRHVTPGLDGAAGFAKVARALGYELNIVYESSGPIMVEARLA